MEGPEMRNAALFLLLILSVCTSATAEAGQCGDDRHRIDSRPGRYGSIQMNFEYESRAERFAAYAHPIGGVF
jgi:hypothetical protein